MKKLIIGALAILALGLSTAFADGATLNVVDHGTYAEADVTGCGYTPNSGIGFILILPGGDLKTGGFSWWGTTSDSNGCIVTQAWINEAGTYTLNAYDGVDKNHKNHLAASVTFTVSDPVLSDNNLVPCIARPIPYNAWENFPRDCSI